MLSKNPTFMVICFTFGFGFFFLAWDMLASGRDSCEWNALFLWHAEVCPTAVKWAAICSEGSGKGKTEWKGPGKFLQQDKYNQICRFLTCEWGKGNIMESESTDLLECGSFCPSSSEKVVNSNLFHLSPIYIMQVFCEGLSKYYCVSMAPWLLETN